MKGVDVDDARRATVHAAKREVYPMSSHPVRPGLATIIATGICLLFLASTLIGVMTYQDPMATKAENFIRMERELIRSPQVTRRP